MTFALLTLLACQAPCEHALTPVSGATTAADFSGYDPAACTPDEAQYDGIVGPVVADACGSCHGETPAYGAPMALTSYDALLDGSPGDRLVDRIARRVASRTMPPPASPALAHAELDTLVEWATCGEVHPDHGAGLIVDRPIYTAPSDETLALPSFDLLAPAFPVDRDTLDRYECFAFDAPIEAERFIRRMQVVVDESRVLHHVVLAADPLRLTDGTDQFTCFDFPYVETPYLYAWAPGTDAFDFEEGGLRVSPGDRLVVQIHYNNGAGLEDATDRSGVRLFHGPPTGTEWIMKDPGPTGFPVPMGESASCDRTVIGEPMRMLAGMPHMHALGAELHQEIERRDGSVEQVVNLTGWNFEAQRFYRYDVELEPGDVLHTWCGFRNETGSDASYGPRTSDEMCYHFVYVAAP